MVQTVLQELCQRKELDNYWCPVEHTHYFCNPYKDLHGMRKTWYYVHKGMLSTVAVTCVCELFPVLLVAHWIACGGAHGVKVVTDDGGVVRG